MPKHFCKVSHYMGQFRITIPKHLVESMQWGDVAYVIVKEFHADTLLIRRFVDGESLKGDAPKDRPGPD